MRLQLVNKNSPPITYVATRGILHALQPYVC